ncbi:MAG: alpha/beta hydrolase family protein [Proteobacteria bacterium]|nr:alpha/beta hydrolase family protein [Pseudomonadota bacterium]
MAAKRSPAWMTGPMGGLVLRPWFDRLALAGMVRGYFPLSRLWAAAEAAGDDVDLFAAEVPMAPLQGWRRSRAQAALAHALLLRSLAEKAEADWRDALFAPGATQDPAEAEARRVHASFVSMRTRARFAFLRRRAPAVRFAPMAPQHLEARFGRQRADPATLFAPADLAVRGSRTIRRDGMVERWLRFPCAYDDIGGEGWAHVYEPEGGFDHTVVMCHGLGIEADAWGEGLAMAPPFVARGLRVIEPEAPWHGRRRPVGLQAGEPFVARGPMGAIDIFAAHVPEIGALVRWARETGGGKVAIGGISLGALGTQLAVAHAATWPAEARPDAALFVTTTDRLNEVAWDGGFATGFGTARAFSGVGWTREKVAEWLPLTAPVGDPGIDPGRIVMALGTADTITPYAGGAAFARRWAIPRENLFVSWQGHFSVALGLARDPRPIARLAELLRA